MASWREMFEIDALWFKSVGCTVIPLSRYRHNVNSDRMLTRGWIWWYISVAKVFLTKVLCLNDFNITFNVSVYWKVAQKSNINVREWLTWYVCISWHFSVPNTVAYIGGLVCKLIQVHLQGVFAQKSLPCLRGKEVCFWPFYFIPENCVCCSVCFEMASCNASHQTSDVLCHDLAAWILTLMWSLKMCKRRRWWWGGMLSSILAIFTGKKSKLTYSPAFFCLIALAVELGHSHFSQLLRAVGWWHKFVSRTGHLF